MQISGRRDRPPPSGFRQVSGVPLRQAPPGCKRKAKEGAALGEGGGSQPVGAWRSGQPTKICLVVYRAESKCVYLKPLAPVARSHGAALTGGGRAVNLSDNGSATTYPSMWLVPVLPKFTAASFKAAQAAMFVRDLAAAVPGASAPAARRRLHDAPLVHAQPAALQLHLLPHAACREGGHQYRRPDG